MTLKNLSPEAAGALLAQGAVRVDIRPADEHAREHIAQARHVPLAQLAQGVTRFEGATAVIFHCRSGARTQMNAQLQDGCAACDAYVLEGGLDAWKRAGLPIVTDTRQPLALQRQVQIAAGAGGVRGHRAGRYGVAVVLRAAWFHRCRAGVRGSDGILRSGTSADEGSVEPQGLLPLSHFPFVFHRRTHEIKCRWP